MPHSHKRRQNTTRATILQADRNRSTPARVANRVIFIHSNETGTPFATPAVKNSIFIRVILNKIARLLGHCGNSLHPTKRESHIPRTSSLVIRDASAQDKIINNDPARNRKRRGTMNTLTKWRSGLAAAGPVLTHRILTHRNSNTHRDCGTGIEISSILSGQVLLKRSAGNLNRSAGSEPALYPRD